MIRARFNDGLFLLGIDAENVRRLKAGMPIMVSLADLGGTDDVVIMYGETMDDIRRDLEEAIGKPLPEPEPLENIIKGKSS